MNYLPGEKGEDEKPIKKNELFMINQQLASLTANFETRKQDWENEKQQLINDKIILQQKINKLQQKLNIKEGNLVESEDPQNLNFQEQQFDNEILELQNNEYKNSIGKLKSEILNLSKNYQEETST